MKRLKLIGWTLFGVGVLAVSVPHIASLIGVTIDLNVISHPISMIIAATIILIGGGILVFKK